LIPPPPCSPLFPSTTLFRSHHLSAASSLPGHGDGQVAFGNQRHPRLRSQPDVGFVNDGTRRKQLVVLELAETQFHQAFGLTRTRSEERRVGNQSGCH